MKQLVIEDTEKATADREGVAAFTLCKEAVRAAQEALMIGGAW